MKKLLSLALVVAFLGMAVTSCNTKKEDKLFDKIIFAEGGDLLGLTLGDTKEAVKAKLPEDAFEEEYEGFMYYSWKIGSNDYYLDLYFNEDNTLFSISGYIYLNTEDGGFDNEAATALFADLKPYFVGKFGTPTTDDADYVAFYSDASDVDLGKGDGEVYFYIAQLYDFDSFDFDFEDEFEGEEVEEVAAN
jgi:hypothetical protein